jgi:hypothetical protein
MESLDLRSSNYILLLLKHHFICNLYIYDTFSKLV